MTPGTSAPPWPGSPTNWITSTCWPTHPRPPRTDAFTRFASRCRAGTLSCGRGRESSGSLAEAAREARVQRRRAPLPDAHARGRFDVQSLAGHDVECVVPGVEIADSVHQVHLRRVVGRQLRAQRRLIRLRAEGLSEGDEELPVSTTRIVL